MKNRPNPMIVLPIILLAILFSSGSCNKESNDGNATIPELTTNTLSDITNNTASGGGVIISNGGAEITESGICWSLTTTPTVADAKTSDNATSGSFTSNMSGLNGNTTYYVRAYATNSQGTGYGTTVSFKTLSSPATYGSMTDQDGNTYKTVTIGTQIWMAENLKTTKYRNGDPIPLVTVAADWEDLSTGAYCYYANNTANQLKWGNLYNGYSVEDPRSICPVGWHMPTVSEFETLVFYLRNAGHGLGMYDDVSKALSDTSEWWTSSNIEDPGFQPETNNASGWSAKPAGARAYLASFDYNGALSTANFWVSLPTSSYSQFQIHYNMGHNLLGADKGQGYSVRCVKD